MAAQYNVEVINFDMVERIIKTKFQEKGGIILSSLLS